MTAENVSRKYVRQQGAAYAAAAFGAVVFRPTIHIKRRKMRRQKGDRVRLK